MKRLAQVLIVWVSLVWPAQTIAELLRAVDAVVEQLHAQGFEVASSGRTFLGRVRIVAYRNELRREIVINPATGEVLRDYSRPNHRNSGDETAASGDDTSVSKREERSHDDHAKDDTDDRDDDDDRDDESDEEDDRDDDDRRESKEHKGRDRD